MEKAFYKDGLSSLLGSGRAEHSSDSSILGLLPAWWERKPEFVVFPQNTEEIVEIIRLSQESGVGILPCGGGTQIDTGYQPNSDRSYILLSLSRMNKILDYQPEDMTIT